MVLVSASLITKFCIERFALSFYNDKVIETANLRLLDAVLAGTSEIRRMLIGRELVKEAGAGSS